MTTTTTELATELELRRLRFFIRRLDYLRPHMACGEQAMLAVLLGKGGPGSQEVIEGMDAAIDRELDRYT